MNRRQKFYDDQSAGVRISSGRPDQGSGSMLHATSWPLNRVGEEIWRMLMTSWKWLRSAICATAMVFGLASQAGAAFPERPSAVIVPWAVGGGTDAVARYIAAVLQDELGQPVNVVNRTGGNGVIGHSAVATAQPDGYTIGLITLEINMMHWMGLTDLTHESYTPLALMNADPAAIHVRTDSKYKTIKDLVDDIKANPGSL